MRTEQPRPWGTALTRTDPIAVYATQPLPIVRPRPVPEVDRGPGPVAPADPGPDRTRWLHTLVGQALDDLDEGRMPVRDALRLVALLAWRDGHEHGR